ncbi:unnamed protein product [Sphagnum balticum]
MNGWVYEGYQVTYDMMGVKFDRDYYESQTYKLGKEIIDEGLAKGVFYKRADGAVAIDLTADGLDEKILLRSDGTSLYMTQDLGTADVRYNEYHMDRMIYVVANEQDYHFKVLKLCLQKLGPFIQYSHARIKSIIRKYASDLAAGDTATPLHSTERELILQIYEYSNVLVSAAATYDPAEVANYVYNLAKLYNKFYNEVPILTAPTPEEKNLRILLSKVTGDTIRKE